MRCGASWKRTREREERGRERKGREIGFEETHQAFREYPVPSALAGRADLVHDELAADTHDAPEHGALEASHWTTCTAIDEMPP